MLNLDNLITAGKFFLVIAGELILLFVAVSFIIGLLMEYLPPSRVRDFLSNKFTWMQYFLGAGLGALTPFCSCSTVPITAGLLKGGVPFGPTMAFLFSSPVLNPIIIALLFSLLGFKVAVVYVVVTFFGSLAVAALLSRLGMERQVKPLVNIASSCCATGTNSDSAILNTRPAAAGCCSSGNAQPLTLITLPISESSCCNANLEATVSPRVPLKEKLKNASTAAVDTFKGVFWYLLLGAGIGAFIYGFFPQDIVVRLAGPGNPWSIPVAAAIGVPMYIRAETVIPIAAALVGKGMGIGTVLALIIGGAGASIPEIIILSSMFKKRLILAFVLNVFAVAIVAGYLVDVLLY